MSVVDFFAATVGTEVGIGVLVGVAGAATVASGIGEVGAIVAALVALASVIEASEERDVSGLLSELRDCVNAD